MQNNYTALFDIHAPFHHPGCIALALEHTRITKPSKIVFGGDLVDNYSVKGNKFKRTYAGPKYIKDEYDICDNEILKPFISVAGGADMWWLEGNHEDRTENRLYDQLHRAGLEGLYGQIPSIPEFFRLASRKIKYVKSKAGNAHVDLTKHLTVMHGDRFSEHAAKLQMMDWGGSLLMGHAHIERTYKKHFGKGREWISLVSGCLCISADYSDIDRWSRGFISGRIDEDSGSFTAMHQPIIMVSDSEAILESPDAGQIRTRKTKGKDGFEKWIIVGAESDNGKNNFRTKDSKSKSGGAKRPK